MSVSADNHEPRLEALLVAAATDAAGRLNALTVAELARVLTVTPSWVYARVDELGGERLGPGARAPIRFDPRVTAARVAALRGETHVARRSRKPPARTPAKHRRRPGRATTDVLPINPRTPNGLRRAA